jgi:hypothetical protein
VLERWGVVPLFAAVVLGITAMAIVYAAIVLRHRHADADAGVAGAEPAPS